MVIAVPQAQMLPSDEAARYAEWFAVLAEPVRVRLLHAVATTPKGITVGSLTRILGISQSTCSFHVRKLADVGFVHVRKEGTASIVTVNQACCVGLPHAADAVMGLLAPRPCCPDDLPDDVAVRALEPADWTSVRGIYTDAAVETRVPSRPSLEVRWLPEHRWVAELDGAVVGFAAATVAGMPGVADSVVAVAPGQRGRGVGKALLHRLVTAADADDTAGVWTLQTSLFPDNRAGLALH
ncbi:MAG: helix-turn-helix domain-containing GNAT family N-acetyltransferase, partial [Thermocrispum sp.]